MFQSIGTWVVAGLSALAIIVLAIQLSAVPMIVLHITWLAFLLFLATAGFVRSASTRELMSKQVRGFLWSGVCAAGASIAYAGAILMDHKLHWGQLTLSVLGGYAAPTLVRAFVLTRKR